MKTKTIRQEKAERETMLVGNIHFVSHIHRCLKNNEGINRIFREDALRESEFNDFLREKIEEGFLLEVPPVLNLQEGDDD